MRKVDTITSPLIKQLLLDLRFSPRRQKLSQLEKAQQLCKIVQPEIDYPYEFICHFITSYRPKYNENEVIPGKILVQDLQAFIYMLSSSVSQRADEVDNAVFDMAQVSEMFHISVRTVERWCKRGLVGRKFIFNDGRGKRTGFTKDAIDDFVKSHKELVEKAQRFSKVRPKDKKAIIDYAHRLMSGQRLSRQNIIVHIAADMARSPDTVRRVLLEYEKSPSYRGLFKKPSGVLSVKDEKNIYKMFCDSVGVETIAAKFYRSKSSIYRIINKRRIRELKKQKIDYIFNEEFNSSQMEEEVLSKPLKKSANINKGLYERGFNPDSLPEYLDDIKVIEPLTRQREYELFRNYNFLKFKAWQIIENINPLKPARSKDITMAEQFLNRAGQIRRELIVSNLRLVVSIANRHIGWGSQLLDLISEGNISLMRAIEKFDYSRGFRFSTYASLAISKDFARMIPAEAKRPDRASSVDVGDVQSDMRKKNLTDVSAIEQAHKSLKYTISNNLTAREQYIINNHYGLIKMGIRKKYKSLKQIGQEIGLSKERVRQLELIALQKLRQCLSAEEFEMLTK